MTTPTFSAVASAIAREFEVANDFQSDPITIESSCGGELQPIVNRGAARRIMEVLDLAGLTPEQFDEELERRTTSKFAYAFGSVAFFIDETVGAIRASWR